MYMHAYLANRISKVTIILFICFIFLLFSSKYAYCDNSIVLDKIAKVIEIKAGTWESVLRGHALTLFKYLLIIDVAWLGIQCVLKRDELMDVLAAFVRLLIFASFMLAILLHFKEWANMLIDGLGEIAETGLGAPAASPSAIFGAGLTMIGNIWAATKGWNPLTSTATMIYALVLFIIFAFIAAQVLLVKCETYIVLNAGIILLGFGGSSFTKDYATNFFRYALSVAVKLFVMQLVVSLGMTFIKEFQVTTANYNEIIVIIGGAIVIYALVNSIPDIVSGIVNGSHVSTGSAITSAATSVATSTMAAMGAMKSAGAGAINAGKAAKTAYDFAKASGATGAGGVAAHMAGTLANAAGSSAQPGKGAAFNSAVQANFENFKMDPPQPSAADTTRNQIL